MIMKKMFSKEVKIGLSVIVAIAILIFGINFLKGVNIFKASNYYYVTYNNINGLEQSASVILNGFKVGQVRDIDYDYEHPGNVKVELSLDKSLRLPQGTKAMLTSDMLGTASITLDLGQAATYLPVGSDLTPEIVPGLMDALSGKLLPSVAQIFPKIDTLLTAVNALAADPALAASIKRLDAITADLAATTQNVAQITRRLAPMTGEVGHILGDVKQITGNVGDITGDVSALSAHLRNLPVDSLVADLQSSVCNLRQLSERLADPDSSLGLLLNDPSLYRNINSTVVSLDSLLIDVKQNPKRYISVKLF